MIVSGLTGIAGAAGIGVPPVPQLPPANACNGGFTVDNSATGCGPNQAANYAGGLAPNSTAIGNAATATGNNAVAVGYQPAIPAGAGGMDSVAIGTNPNAGNVFDPNGRGQNAIAIGTNSNANFNFGANAVAIGANSNVNGSNSTAIGASNNVSGNNSGAFGTGQTINGNGSFGFGDPNTINGNATFVTGNNNTVNGPNVGGNGDNIQVVGSNNTLASTAGASGSSVFGVGNTVNATNTVVMGNTNTVTGASGVAIGNGVSLGGANAVAVGTGTSANFDNSAAFGNGATVTRANQQVFGTATNTYTMPGITSAASKAAQSGPVQIVTSDAGGNLATNTAAGLGLASATDIAVINSQIGGINARLNDLDARTTKALNGTAMALAMAGVPWLDRTERFAVSSNWGTFQGTNGIALNAALRLGTNVQANGGIAYGANGGGLGGRVGVRWGW